MLLVKALKNTFAFNRICHECIRLRSLRVFHKSVEINERINHSPIARIMDFKMQMRRLTTACITAHSYELPFRNWEFVGSQYDISKFAGIANPIYFVFLSVALSPSANYHSQGRHKILHVSVDTRLSIGVFDIKSIAVTVSNSYTTDIPFTNRKDRQALYPFRANVNSSMEMIRTRFTKISCQCHRDMHWRRKLHDSS